MARLCIVLCALTVLSSAALEDEFAATKSCDEMNDIFNLLQKDAKLRDRTNREHRAGAAMTAKDLLTLRSDPFQRVWFLCKGPPPQPRTEEMIAAEIEVEDEMMCTAEMTFEGLCCAPWSTGLDYSQQVSLGLKAEQEQTSLGDATESVIKLCTESAAGEILTNGEHGRMPVQCFEEQFTQADLTGNSTLGAGEIVLRARISFFLQQGISVDAIPLCANEVSMCEDGSAPAVVQDDWIQALKWVPSQHEPELTPPQKAMLQEQRAASHKPASSMQPYWPRAAGLRQEATVTHTQHSTVLGALMTSGSFTMMAAAGG